MCINPRLKIAINIDVLEEMNGLGAKIHRHGRGIYYSEM